MIHPHSYLLCCDWGTSSFRLRLVQRSSQKVVHEITSSEGVASIFQQWQQTPGNLLSGRESYFLDFLMNRINQLAQKIGVSLDEVNMVLTGMASSSVGLRELPYAHTPISLDGSQLVTEQLSHDRRVILMVSGLRTSSEVMRGEEIQMIGLEEIAEQFQVQGEQLVVVLPGTHSKHVKIKDGMIFDFSTAMTGELFALLISGGLLSYSITKPRPHNCTINWKYFREGVRLSLQHSLMHSLFRIRTNDLLKGIRGTDNYYYLSGLLIGSELAQLKSDPRTRIILNCGSHLKEYYQCALDELGMKDRTYSVPTDQFDHLLIRGQIKMANRAGL